MLGKFKNENASHSLLETFPPCATTNNNLVNCTICTDGKQHKMRQKYLLCTSKICGEDCTAKYKIENCLKKGKIVVFSLNEHLIDHNQKHGLTKEMKVIIEQIITEHDFHTPKQILIKFNRMKRKGILQDTPNLVQLTNYLAYRRKKLGNTYKYYFY